MAIEILGYANRPVTDNHESAPVPAGGAGKAPVAKGPGTATDQFSLTSSAALLKDLEREISQLPVVDAGRVEGVQRALATGTFQVDPPRVADKLLQLELIMSAKD
jgi:negative regulator of flagellin synthesis FlgM